MAKIHTIDGVQYREVARDAKVGDFLLFEGAPYSFLTSGKVYKVTGIDSYGDPEIIDDEGDKILIEEGYVVLEQVGAADLYALESELAAMKAKVAEMEAQLAEVKKAEAERTQAERLKVGDYAKVVCDYNISGNKRSEVKIGEIRKIIGDDGSEIPYKAERLDGADYEWFRSEALVRATDEEVAEAKRKLAQDMIQPGAYVKLQIAEGKEPYYGWGHVRNGDIGKVRTRDEAIVTVDFPKQSCWTAKIHELAVVTDEEVVQHEEIERNKAEEAKWHAIGREVGEFKKGDVVRIVPKNVIGKVEDVGTSLLGICDYSGKYYGPGKECVELIAPVKSVVNLRAGDVS